MHLEMKTQCEECGASLVADGPAYICSYECTFCPTCASRLKGTCSHCSGELIRRPRRKALTADAGQTQLTALDHKRPWLIWVASFGMWILIALVNGVSMYQFDRQMKPSVTLIGEIKLPLINFLIFAVLTPLIFYIGSRYPVQRHNWLRRTPLYLLGALAFTVLHGVVRMLVYPINNPATGKPCPIGFALFRSVFLYNVADDVFYVYLPILMIVHTLWYYQRFQERELRTAHLQTELAKAHLQALKNQLQPHFLFNTMHSISSLMLTDVGAADRMMTRLSDLLRMSLENKSIQETTLSQELEFVSRYLEIEKIRFEDRLNAVVDVPPDTLDALVPHLLLQPLVENAVRHGISRRTDRGEIRIAAHHDSTTLYLDITDNGPGLEPDNPMKTGMGLKTTRERLRTLYGGEQSLEIRSVPEGGVEVCVQIPFCITAPELLYEIVSESPEPLARSDVGF
jgi:two-component system LytT family sensor kinase